jgi:hypothetical protein
MKPVRTADLTHAAPLDAVRRTPQTQLLLDERGLR